MSGQSGQKTSQVGADNAVYSAVRTVAATIADAASLSAAVDLGVGMSLVGVQSGAAWTAGVLSFQVSADNSTWVEYFNTSGVAVVTASLALSQRMGIDPSDFLSVRYLKVRSGTSGTPVTQSGGGGGLTLFVRGL